MEVSSKQLLNKMEELVGKAKQANTEEKLKGYILAIQAMCEVMINDEPSTPSLSITNNEKPVPTTTVQTLSNVTVSKPVQIDQRKWSFDF